MKYEATKRFRLGIITDEVSQNIDEAIEFARYYGLEAIELRSVNDKSIHILSDDEIDEIHERVIANGLRVSGVAGPLFKCHLGNPEEVAAHLKMAERLIEIAARLNAGIVRGFSFWAERPFAEALPDIAAQLKKLVPLLDSKGVTLALEFDPSVYASNAVKTAEILNILNCSSIQALYDPGNDLWDPDGEIPYPDGYEAISNQICHVHLKDARQTTEGVEAVAIGKGQVDYRRIFSRLDRDGYEGYLVVETHYRMKSKLSEEQLKRPAGNAFSEGGREASEHCIEHLYGLLSDLGFAGYERE